MLGPSLLVAPVLSENGDVEYYLPPGRWTNYLTDEIADGGAWRREQPDFLSIPLWVKENTVIAVGANAARPDYDYADGVTLHLFSLRDGADLWVEIPDTQGNIAATFRCVRLGRNVRITRDGAAGTWGVQLRGPGKSPALVSKSNQIEFELEA